MDYTNYGYSHSANAALVYCTDVTQLSNPCNYIVLVSIVKYVKVYNCSVLFNEVQELISISQHW